MSAAVLQAVPLAAVGAAAALVAVGALAAALVGVVHRWYAGSAIPTGLAVLLAVSAVAVDINAGGSLRAVIGGDRGLLDVESVVFNSLTLLATGAVGALAGRLGDAVAASVGATARRGSLRGGLGRVGASVGVVRSVTLPEEIADIEGYDPVPPEQMAALAGETLTLSRGLAGEQLHERVVERLKTEYGVGHVDLELASDGTVERLAVGRRPAGIGATLPPGTVAVAVRADPPFSAGVGDRVLVYEPARSAPGADPEAAGATDGDATANGTEDPAAPDDERSPGEEPAAPAAGERVAVAELRAVAGDVVTLVVDAADADALDDATRYRLVTLPASPRAEDEFAGLLRAADETMAAVTVGEGADLVGLPVGSIDATVVAVRPADGRVETLPGRDRTLSAGETVYVVGRPETLRRLGAAGAGG